MTDKHIKEEIKHINKRNQEYIAENNRMTEKIIDGLSCNNCTDAQRCQEQQTKKEYAINQVLQDIPSEYANVIDRLKQIIPSITRCDYVLEKQLKRKEKEIKEIKKYLGISDKTIIQHLEELQERRDELSEENEKLKEELDKYLNQEEEIEKTKEQLAKLQKALEKLKKKN